MKATLTHIVRERILHDWVSMRPHGVARIPTELELSSKYDVSVTTIRRAIDKLVQDGLLMRRQGSGTYTTARQPQSRRIALFVPDVRLTPYFITIARKIEPLLRQHKYTSTLVVTEDAADLNMAEWEQQTRPDGVIICGYLLNEQLLRQKNWPIVVAGSEGGVTGDCVNVDLKGGTALAIQSLIRQGHRRILFLSSRGPSGAQKDSRIPPVEASARYLGYRAALEQNSLPLDASLVVDIGASKRSAYTCMKQIFQSGRRDFSAIFAWNDPMAEGVAMAAIETGVRIPEDVSLIGCDNLLSEEDHVMSLTTLDLRIDDIAQRAVDLLMQRIAQPDRQESQVISLVPTLIERATTGPATEVAPRQAVAI